MQSNQLIYSASDDRVVNVRTSIAEVWGSNPESVKTDPALPTAHHRCAIYLKEAELHGSTDGPC